MAKCYIGTSGFSYQHWYGNFYPHGLPQNGLLDFYCRHFGSVEINSTFYNLPFSQTFTGWQARTPEDFMFALKGSRYITHRLRLRRAQEPVSKFCGRARILGKKLGPVLWQLPPYLKPDLALLADFIGGLPKDIRHAFEFRNDDWLKDETFDVLRKNGAGYCIVSAPGMACVNEATAPFVYIRMHGISGWYCYDYNENDLQWWADKIRGFLKKKLDVCVYFNNDASGFAPRNAIRLRQILGQA